MTDCQTLNFSMYFKSDWLEQLLEDCAREGVDYRNVELLPQECRSAVWNVCVMLSCQTHGVPGQACRLLELYLYRFLNSPENTSDHEVQLTMVENLMPRLLLMITSCVQLSAKMSSGDTSYNASIVQAFLLTKGESHTIEEINNTEAEILKTLDFRVPLWTSVDIAELLASELKLSANIVKAVIVIVDLAEYYRAAIEKKVLWIVKLSTKSQRGSGVRTLHLAAGAVAAAARLARAPDAAPALAALLRLPRRYVECLRDVTLKQTAGARTTPAILKRKSSASISDDEVSSNENM